MNDYDIIITIGAIGRNKEEVLDNYSDILFLIQKNISMDNYEIKIIKRGEFIE